MENGLHDARTSGLHNAQSGYFSLYPTNTGARDDGSSQVFSELEVRRQREADVPSVVTTEARATQAQRFVASTRSRLRHHESTSRSYAACLPVPLLDSFPTIYGSRSRASNGLAARASLAMESSVAGQISHMQRRIGRIIGLDEREMLLDGLGHIADAYRERWGSDADSGDDL